MCLCVCVYLVGPDEGLDSQVILNQLLHVGLSSNQRGELRSLSEAQWRLVGGARGGAGVSVPEEDVPRLREGREDINMAAVISHLVVQLVSKLISLVLASLIFILITIMTII